MSVCTSGVGLKVLHFRDNQHFGSIRRSQPFSC